MPTPLNAANEAADTLIAIGSSAAAIATEREIGSARSLHDGLTKPEPYIQSVIRQWQGARTSPDAALQYPWDGAAGDEKPT